MAGLQFISNQAVSTLKPPLSLPAGNADTITNALGPWNGKPGFDNRTRDLVRGAAETGFFSYDTPSCGRSSGGPGVGSQLKSLGIVTGVQAGLSAIPVVGGAISSLAGLVLKPFQHHAQAVKTEQATLCQAVPDANNFLRGIDAAVASGQLDRDTAAQALEQGFQNWRAEVAGILKDSGGKCNAACGFEKAFRAAIEKRKQDYALAGAQNSSGAQGLLHGVVNAFEGAVSTVRAFISPSTFSPPASGSDRGFGTVSAAGASAVGVSAAGLVAGPGPGKLAGFLVIGGGVLVAGILWFQFIRGAKK